MTDGTVASNTQEPVYDVNGNMLTNTHLPGHSASTNILPYEFLTRMSTYGEPLNLFAKGTANMFADLWGIRNRILAGMEWKMDANFGRGKVFDPLMPPSSGIRMRSYREIPALNQISAYVEDNISKEILGRDLKVQLGLRFDMIQPGRKEGGNVLSPRINASYDIIPDRLAVRGGWGLTAKAPPLVYLYPDKAYFDFVNFSNIGQTGIADDQTLSMITTKVYDTSNDRLRIARNRKSEIGLDFTYNDMRLSVTAYSEKLTDGYSFGLDRSSFRLFELKKYTAGSMQEGKVLHWGMCEVNAETICRAHAACPLTAIQSEYHLAPLHAGSHAGQLPHRERPATLRTRARHDLGTARSGVAVAESTVDCPHPRHYEAVASGGEPSCPGLRPCARRMARAGRSRGGNPGRGRQV